MAVAVAAVATRIVAVDMAALAVRVVPGLWGKPLRSMPMVLHVHPVRGHEVRAVVAVAVAVDRLVTEATVVDQAVLIMVQTARPMAVAVVAVVAAMQVVGRLGITSQYGLKVVMVVGAVMVGAVLTELKVQIPTQ